MLADSSLSLYGLFVSAFVSSTLLPGGSEVLLGLLAARSNFDPLVLLSVATAGNTAGGMSTWLLGRLIAKRYPARTLVTPRQRAAVSRVHRWGAPVLLFSWLPAVGDVLCLVAGWLRVHALAALMWIALGKALRYALVIWVMV